MKINDTIEKQNEERHAVGNNQLFYGKLTEEEKETSVTAWRMLITTAKRVESARL